MAPAFDPDTMNENIDIVKNISICRLMTLVALNRLMNSNCCYFTAANTQKACDAIEAAGYYDQVFN